MSREGLEKLKLEIEERKNERRPEIAKIILEATGHGDLSENAEYIEAKELQAFNEGRIEELEKIIRKAVLISKTRSKNMIAVGSTVEVQSEKFGKQQFTIVGPSESSPANGFISNESPLGAAFLDKKKDEEVNVKTPAGSVKYIILNIE